MGDELHLFFTQFMGEQPNLRKGGGSVLTEGPEKKDDALFPLEVGQTDRIALDPLFYFQLRGRSTGFRRRRSGRSGETAHCGGAEQKNGEETEGRISSKFLQLVEPVENPFGTENEESADQQDESFRLPFADGDAADQQQR